MERAGGKRMARLLDPRVVLGVVLMAASVLSGVRVLAAAEPDRQLWAATRDLPAGVHLQATDVELVAVSVPFYDAYVTAGDQPKGQLQSALRAGELIGAADLVAPGQDSRVVAVPVALERLGTEVDRGSIVDVWGTISNASDSTLVAGQVLIDSVARDQDWANGAATVLLRVTEDQVGPIVSATRTGDVDLVVTGAAS